MSVLLWREALPLRYIETGQTKRTAAASESMPFVVLKYLAVNKPSPRGKLL
jgi:hypothetical protein